MVNTSGIISTEDAPHLLIPLPHTPEVIDVQLWFHVLLSVEGDEWHLGEK